MAGDGVLRGPQMEPGLAHDLAVAAEDRAMALVSAHVKQFKGNMARAELAAVYIAARAYVLHNRYDEVTVAELEARAAELAEGMRIA